MKKGILFMTSYPSRECGIATYSQDLVKAIEKKFNSSFTLSICALEESKDKYIYPKEVKYTLDTTDFTKYLELAEKINKDDSISCVCIQHEFGLFSGSYGENILYFLCSVSKPVVTTFHTVLPQADEKHVSIVKAIMTLSDNIIISTQTSAKLLEYVYGADPKKITVIPHGTHSCDGRIKNEIKAKYKLSDKFVLSTFGLISSNKNIETAIEALVEIKKEKPNVLYIILGKTHPGVIKHEAEKYRESLQQKVDHLNLNDNVLFINKYLSLDELLDYLSMTDIYLFTSKDPYQAVSGTFAYAMASGCPIIATPIPHAKELLNAGTGKLFDFGNSKQLAQAVVGLIKDDNLREEMGKNALRAVRASAWENVSISHATLFNECIKSTTELIYEMPEISLQHINAMTTSSGMLQFSQLNDPDINSGYTLDDNARAMIAVAKYYEITGDDSQINKLDVYLNYIKFCQCEDGTFRNYVDYNGTFNANNDTENLEDSNGRAIWALGTFVASCQNLHPYFLNRATYMFTKAAEKLIELKSPRAISFAIKGLYQYNTVHDNLKIKFIIHVLSKKLMENYYENFDHRWEWFEQYLTYANSAMPEAMLCAYLSSGDEMYKVVAKDSFDFLISKTFSDNAINVISNKGWHQRGAEINKYGEQPIDISYTILALQSFYTVFKDEKYKKLMDTAFSWFLGNNHLKQVIYNTGTGGCYDGLEEKNVNLNQGAESTICYLMARLAMEEMKPTPLTKPILTPFKLNKHVWQPLVLSDKTDHKQFITLFKGFQI